MTKTHAWSLPDWQKAYAEGVQPNYLLTELLDSLSTSDAAWISLISQAQLKTQLSELAEKLANAEGDLTKLPLYGVPFAAKDNIDALPLPTTAACPEFAYLPQQDATVIRLLKEAGAILVGKTNLDQFATGLVGTRSPYGAVPNTFDSKYISGGSSSGSASAVARGIVPFALGTDTAGSGRVPASLNNIIGLKGTVGAISTHGVVPACKTLDVVSIFALTLNDAHHVFDVAAQFDKQDAYSRAVPKTWPRQPSGGKAKRLGYPAQPRFFGDSLNAEAWQQCLAQWQELNVELVPIDFAPLHDLAALLYEGPWVAERYAAIESFLQNQANAMNPVVRGIIEQATNFTAVDVFQAEYKRMALKRQIANIFTQVDALVVPSAPTFPTLADVAAEPVLRNSELGTYTNFVNLADLCALAVPACFRSDGLPFGITLIAPAWHDKIMQTVAAAWLNARQLPIGATKKTHTQAMPAAPAAAAGYVRVAVVGAHLTGMPLNYQLTDRGAVLVEQTTTTAAYKLYALANTTPPKPGLVHSPNAPGQAIKVELWDMPLEQFGSFVALIPSPLGIGTLSLKDGRQVKGFICEGWAIEQALDITAFGGWRAYLNSINAV